MDTSLSFAFGFVLNKASGLSLSSSVTHCEPSVCSTGSLKVDADLVILTIFQVCCWERGEVAESDDVCSHFQCRDAPSTD